MRTPPILPLLITIGLLLPLNSWAQIKGGFKLYRKKKPLKSEVKMTRALRKAQQEPVAQLGLYYLDKKNNSRKSYQQLQALFQKLQRSQKEFSALKPRRKLFYKKNKHIKLTAQNYERAIAEVQRAALDQILLADSLLLLDSFRINMAPIHPRLEDEYEALEDSLVISNFHSAYYETLRSIAKNYLHVLKRKQRRITPSFNMRLMVAFLAKYPLHQFQSFTDDFPFHWAARDCYTPDFLQVVKSRSLQSMAYFLESCHMTELDWVVMYAALSPVNNEWLAQKGALSPHELTIITELVNTASWIVNGMQAEDRLEQFISKVKRQLEVAAPSNRSYLVLIAAMAYLRERRAWEASLDLMKYARPLFINEHKQLEMTCFFITEQHNRSEEWFDAVIGYLEVPAEGAPTTWLDPVNTRRNEIAPVVSVDDSIFYYGLHWFEDKMEFKRVSGTERKGGNWQEPRQVKSLATNRLDAPMSISADRQYMLVNADQQLSICEYKGGQWSVPRPILSPNVFDWTGNAALSPDGKVVIFEASHDPRPIENEHNIDLYVTVYDEKEKSWSEAKMLSSTVNTDWQEISPFIHADNRTLLFTSQAHNSFANFDVFMAERLDDTWLNWSTPKNLGKEVNSYRNDWSEKFTMPASGKKAYLSQNSSPSLQRQDILEIQLPTYARPRRMLVVKGELEAVTKNTRLKIGMEHPLDQPSIDSFAMLSGGHFQLLFEDGISDSLVIYADDPEIYSTIIRVAISALPDVSELKEVPLTIPLGKIIAQEIPVPLEQLRFKKGSTELSRTAKRELRWLARYCLPKPQLTLLVGGYADGEGTMAQQEALSLKRAETVKAYLIEQGLPWDRIWTQGFADKKPIPAGQIGNSKRQVTVYLK